MNTGPDFRFAVLLGLMGVGKSTVGRLLAARLGWPLSDSDEHLRIRTGHSARELERTLGADALHELEAGHLLSALAGEQPAVICAAASTIEVDRCREALAAPEVLAVWLRATPAELAARFEEGPHRPSYGGRPLEFLTEQQRRRGPLFGAAAALVLDTAGASPAELAQAIVGRIQAG